MQAALENGHGHGYLGGRRGAVTSGVKAEMIPEPMVSPREVVLPR